jgi:multidrug transporter EmrE-like cation transporter
MFALKREMIALLSLVLLISASECLGQSCLKSFYKNPTRKYLYFLGVIFYSIVCLLLVLSYKYKGMGLVNVLWSGISVLAVVSVGAIYFDETITTMDMLGIGLILCGIGLVVYEGDHA